MQKFPIVFSNGHLFVELEGSLYLFDTGAPTSFGEFETLSIVGSQFSLDSDYFGLTAEKLAEYTGVQCAGLLGADILENFDYIIDCAKGVITVTADEMEHNVNAINLSTFMGIPVLTARIFGAEYRMFFDTGAQVSYFQNEALTKLPTCGSMTDFYPGVGQFETETYQLEVSLGGVDLTLRCGTLPGLLGATLMMADAHGIIGNEILLDRVVGYFPRRGLLCL
jgi:hypothetical protein